MISHVSYDDYEDALTLTLTVSQVKAHAAIRDPLRAYSIRFDFIFLVSRDSLDIFGDI